MQASALLHGVEQSRLLHLTFDFGAGVTVGVEEVHQGVVGLQLVQTALLSRCQGVGEIGGGMPRAVSLGQAAGVGSPLFQSLFELRMLLYLMAEGEEQGFVLHGRMGVVPIAGHGFPEVPQHGAVGSRFPVQDGNGTLGQRWRDLPHQVHEVDEGLLGYFRRVEVGGVGKVEMVPIVFAYIVGPGFGGVERGRHFG